MLSDAATVSWFCIQVGLVFVEDLDQQGPLEPLVFREGKGSLVFKGSKVLLDLPDRLDYKDRQVLIASTLISALQPTRAAAKVGDDK